MEPYLPNYLKGKNRRLVFDLLRERGQMSRAEITRDTGMSFPTAMKVVDAFLEKGLLVELDETGPAAVSVTTRQDGSAEQTLVLQLGGYSLYFAAAAS